MLGRPENWVLMLQWLWAYGDEVYMKKVKEGSMLRPLDSLKLNMLVQDDNDADCDSIRLTKAYLGEDKDLARGIMCLFEGWEVFSPRIHRDKEVGSSWHITFRVCVLWVTAIRSAKDWLRILRFVAFGYSLVLITVLSTSMHSINVFVQFTFSTTLTPQIGSCGGVY